MLSRPRIKCGVTDIPTVITRFMRVMTVKNNPCVSVLILWFFEMDFYKLHCMKTPTLPFAAKTKKNNITVTLVREKDFSKWIKSVSNDIQALVKQTGFGSSASKTLITPDHHVFAGVSDKLKIYDIAPTVEAIRKYFSSDFLKTATFTLEGKGDLTAACMGWGISCYQYDRYKKSVQQPQLVLPKDIDEVRVRSVTESIYMLKNMVNTPANDMSPADIEKVAISLDGEVGVTSGKTLEKEFPLIHMVGKAAEEGPRLIDLQWGKKSHPKVTILGKGVSFDTGGLNIKPTQYMALMRKDMGGAAHALALGKLIMDLKLPVRLRVLVPAVENSISDEAFRPGDIVKSRSGLTVENTNTDAEGRLILADTLTYACEDNPDLLIDFATLTGSARAALGPDIPAAFATRDKTGNRIQKLAMASEDPIWLMPLYTAYEKHIKSPNADIHNSAKLPGDLIYSALFLKQFLKDDPDWVHLDCHAWELTGKPGRPSGAADTGLLSMLAYIEDRYA